MTFCSLLYHRIAIRRLKVQLAKASEPLDRIEIEQRILHHESRIR